MLNIKTPFSKENTLAFMNVTILRAYISQRSEKYSDRGYHIIGDYLYGKKQKNLYR